MRAAEQYQAGLDPSPKKFDCPSCGRRRFVRYVERETNEYLPEQYGRCDREDSCGYHHNPYKDGYYSDEATPPRWKPVRQRTPVPAHKTQRPPLAPIPPEVLEETRQGEQNTFLQNLSSSVAYPFPRAAVSEVASLYRIGDVQAAGKYSGTTTFPFIDRLGEVRVIQVKQFDAGNHTVDTNFLHAIYEQDCKRQNKPRPAWLEAYLKNERKVSCLFGENLLDEYPEAPVFLVEAPKTAIYGALYYGLPERRQNPLWLAVYNKRSLTYEKLKVLRGRQVTIFPDLSKGGETFREWDEKAKRFEKRLNQEFAVETAFEVSDLLERAATKDERAKGLDLADYLIRQDWREFPNRWEEAERPPSPKPEAPKRKALGWGGGEVASAQAPDRPVSPSAEPPAAAAEKRETDVSKNPTEAAAANPTEGEDWRQELTELGAFFLETLPASPVRLNACTLVDDPALFVTYTLRSLRRHNGNPAFRAGLSHLRAFRQVLEGQGHPLR